MRLPIGRGSHRDGGNEEVPGEEGAQTQNEEADPDQVVAVGDQSEGHPEDISLGRPSRPSVERTTIPITLVQAAKGIG